MTHQRYNLESRSLAFRQRVVKATLKALFVFFVVCIVFAFWASLVGCSLMQPIRYLDDLGDTSGDPVWPAQGCGIPKLTDDEPTDPAFWRKTINPL